MERWNGGVCGEIMDPASQSYIPVATAAAGTHPSSGYSETCIWIEQNMECIVDAYILL